MRPATLEHFFGQQHLIAEGKPLRTAIESGQPHSMIFWGPPGTGKTTLAKLIAHQVEAEFITLSAVLSGVKDIRAAIDKAKQIEQAYGRGTVLFVDEVHRFNKSQQDAFLPFVEDGTVTFIGATTENPSFELNNALLSRARVYKLKSLTPDDIRQIIDHAINEGLTERNLIVEEPLRDRLAEQADGDARRALNLLEIAADLAEPVEGNDEQLLISEETLNEIISGGVRRFDKGGEEFYDQISAMHKSMRGSNPDACLYWLARMLDGGCDPLYIARRVVRMASEDVGNADPRALTLALNAWDVQERLGSPEGELAIAQAIVYLAVAPKSNAVYKAFNAVMADVRSGSTHEVPIHLRNAPTKLMKELGYGHEYRYAHDEPEGYAAGESYFPEDMTPQNYYQPVDRGLEQKIQQKLAHLRELDERYRNNSK
ncbi:MAG: replication-associated recombination protein A [Gammaproteobacteria bacterium]|nr:replication-associated recombination protein A [Gammaproteobacteria bacterium]